MRNLTFLFLALAGFIASCKPDPALKPDDREPPKQYSYWVVNEDSFRTNEVTLNIGKAEAFLSANRKTIYDNSFTIHFNTGYKLPTTGSFLLNCNVDNSDVVCFSIVYDSAGYYEPATLQYLQASKKKWES